MSTIEDWIKSSPLDATDKTLLVEHVTGQGKVAQLIHGDKKLSAEELASLNRLSKERLSGVPLPYLTGSQEFFGRPFAVNPSVLIPRPDTECLLEWLIENIPSGKTVCDLGTGSGCIAVTLKLERPDLTVLASDISSEALSTAKQNARALGAEISFFEGSWLEPYPEDCVIDAVVSNPPYIAGNDTHLEALRYEPQNALTDNSDGLEAYRSILEQVRSRSPLPATIAVEHGWDQEDEIQRLFSEWGFDGSKTYRDYGNNPRYTVWSKEK